MPRVSGRVQVMDVLKRGSWVTVVQVAARCTVNRATTSACLRKYVELGLAERRRDPSRTGQYEYRLVKGQADG